MSFSDVSGASKYFVTPNEGFSTTTSGATASGATTVGLNSVSGLTNGTTFVGVIEPAGTKEQIFTGVVDTSGSQITGVVWTKGSNIDHATGVSVVDYDTGTALKLMTTGILKEHTQTGTHGAITGTSANVTGALTGTSLVNAAHTHANAAGGGQITQAGLNLSKTTDANGWTVYNYGNWTQYRKRVTYSQAFTAGTAASITLSSTNLPAALATLGTNFINASLVQSGSAYTMDWNLEMVSTSTTLVVTGVTRDTATFTGFIDITITSA